MEFNDSSVTVATEKDLEEAYGDKNTTAPGRSAYAGGTCLLRKNSIGSVYTKLSLDALRRRLSVKASIFTL